MIGKVAPPAHIAESAVENTCINRTSEQTRRGAQSWKLGSPAKLAGKKEGVFCFEAALVEASHRSRLLPGVKTNILEAKF